MTESDKSYNGSQKIIAGHRPARYYLFPDIEALCAKFGVQPSGGDEIGTADVGGVKTYRLALEREFIKRQPGTHFVDFLAARLSLSARTIQRYHRETAFSYQPTYEEMPIHRANLHRLPSASDAQHYGIESWGHFLEDERGLRCPPIREIALKWLKSGRTLTYRVQRGNFYWYGEQSPIPIVTRKPLMNGGPQHTMSSQPPSENISPPIAAWLAKPLQTSPTQRVLAPRPPSTVGTEGLAPSPAPPLPIARQLPLIPGKSAPPELKTPPKRESKRKYRRPLEETSKEWLAQRVYDTVRELAPHGQTMSIFNARRLVETYSFQSVSKTLNKMQWLNEQGKIANPAGFMVVASRQQWRIDNGATELGAPAPRFQAEPVQYKRNRPRPKTERVHKSEWWLARRIDWEISRGELDAADQWEAKLDALIESRPVKHYRWRLKFAREYQSPDDVEFWTWILARKEGTLDE